MKAPQPVNMLRDSRRFVLPVPLLPRIKLIPGSQFVLRSGPEKFLKLRMIVLSILKVKTEYLTRCLRYGLADVQILRLTLVLAQVIQIRRTHFVPESLR